MRDECEPKAKRKKKMKKPAVLFLNKVRPMYVGHRWELHNHLSELYNICKETQVNLSYSVCHGKC